MLGLGQDTGQPVVEDLERSRTIAFDLVKFVAGEAAIGAQRAEAILESTTYSTVQIRDAYAACKTAITNGATVQDLRTAVNDFINTYQVS